MEALLRVIGFDRDGVLWVTSSGSQFGRVTRMGAADAANAAFELPTGSEDIAFDDAGRLWCVSEAGSLRWRHWRDRSGQRASISA